MPKTLHFVYNADGTPSAILRDFIHRLRSPETYPCRLCDLTYGRFIKRGDWQRFTDSLGIACSFHLRNVCLRRHPEFAGARFPAVYLERDGNLTEFISAEAIEAVTTLDALKELVSKKVAPLI